MEDTEWESLSPFMKSDGEDEGVEKEEEGAEEEGEEDEGVEEV